MLSGAPLQQGIHRSDETPPRIWIESRLMSQLEKGDSRQPFASPLKSSGKNVVSRKAVKRLLHKH